MMHVSINLQEPASKSLNSKNKLVKVTLFDFFFVSAGFSTFHGSSHNFFFTVDLARCRCFVQFVSFLFLLLLENQQEAGNETSK